jgi:hypothetical protein
VFQVDIYNATEGTASVNVMPNTNNDSKKKSYGEIIASSAIRIATGSSCKSRRKGRGKSKSKKEITPQEAVALIASIIIIILAFGGLVYNVFA